MILKNKLLHYYEKDHHFSKKFSDRQKAVISWWFQHNLLG